MADSDRRRQEPDGRQAHERDNRRGDSGRRTPRGGDEPRLGGSCGAADGGYWIRLSEVVLGVPPPLETTLPAGVDKPKTNGDQPAFY
jgi:hypothetical protein